MGDRATLQTIRVLHAVVNITAGGGAESLIMNVYRNIDRDKVQFDFLTSIEGSYEGEIREMGGRVYRVPRIRDVGPFGYRSALAEFFAGHKECDIVHSHMDKMSGVVLDEAKNAGIPIRIAHSHSTANEGGWLERAVKQHYGKLLRHAPTDRIACSRDAGEWLFPDATDKVTIMRNGVVFDDFCFSEAVRTEKRAELGLSGRDRVLLHVGRFDRAKNQRFAVDVLKSLDDGGGDYRLLFAGAGGLMGDVESHAREAGVSDKAIFLGLRNDMPGLMAAADVFIFPSLYEGLSVALMEAQASGLPCVITDSLSEESTVRPDLVTRLPLGDAGAWAAAVRHATEARDLADRTFAAPPEYDVKRIAKELERFYIQRAAEEGLYAYDV
jgi:glycosyltransferase involved in cell wall biosynthesis